MKPLLKELRNKFERTIENAREVAEEAARIALEQLGVGEASPYSYLSEDERALRRRLRAHGRNLGDVRDPKSETQEIDRLVEEIAYEHWHRMLFARFLAENDLLMYYEDDDIENAVPVTLSECDELAEELGLKNGWEVAAKLATKMLPQVFRADSPVFKIGLSPEKQRQLENLVSNIEHDVFNASDSLGWAYQFWQNKKKEIINKSEVKIGARELPAVTQLFTEPYMVEFLLDNSIGSLWLNKISESQDLSIYKSEEEIRKACSISNAEFKYLRAVKNEDGNWKGIGESLSNISDNLSNFKLLDPCCGSGHFLVSAFNRLVPLRMKLENLSASEACNLVIKENIYGLEIDRRCVELAAFALALSAWKYPESQGFRLLPELNIAWCGQPINIKKNEWLELAEENQDIKLHLEVIYNVFKNANVLGSLINPKIHFDRDSLFEKEWGNIHKIVENHFNKNADKHNGLGVIAKGIEKAFSIINDKYDLVITNVPYLLRGKQSKILKEYADKNYPDSKNDLATIFIERCLELSKVKGNISLVTPQNWQFLTSYKSIREKLLKQYQWNYSINLGSGAFETISGEMVKVVLLQMTNKANFDVDYDSIHGLDVSEHREIKMKAKHLTNENMIPFFAKDQLNNPDSRIIFNFDNDKELLQKYADTCHGLVTFDRPRFIINHWERNSIDSGWVLMQSRPDKEKEFSGFNEILRWEEGTGELFKLVKDKEELEGYRSGVWKGGIQHWGKKGVLHGVMSDLPSTLYLGYPFDSNVAPLIPQNDSDLLAIWAYSRSGKLSEEVRRLDKKIMVTNATLVKVPFDKEYWEEVAKVKYPQGIPKPYADDSTQWIFHGHPRKSAGPLQVAVARLMGYRWPAELDSEMELSDEAKALVKESEGLLSFADKDGIVCIPSVRGEAPASERLLNLLAAAYKDEDINMILPGLLSDADHAGKSLESWLRDKFFTQHYKLFGHRPFIWQIWDGLKDGFSALVNYHKLDRKNLETLIYTYLGDWIIKQKSAMVEGIEGAEEKLNAAISLKKKLELILEGESPYDIFVRWKPLNKQPLGWEPDLNDGVRINIRPFISVGDVGKKGAGVLRDKPNIKWTKDRGKDTENSPWYHLFGGDRINDHHVTLEEKKKAREEMR